MKQSKWPVVQFAEILERVKRQITLDDIQSYDCVGVRWYGMGAFVRESKLGADIRRKKQWIIKEGDVVYNKLFAWRGAFAVADVDVDECIVSDKFPTYRLDENRVDPQYLRYFFHTELIARQAQDLSKGAAAISKLTLNPPDFWKLSVPLPPLDEQHRIVAHIEELGALIEEARELRFKAREEAEILLASVLRTIFDSWQGTRVTVEELVGRENLRNGKSVRTTELPTDINCLRLSALREGRVNCTDTKPVLLTAEEASPYLVREGDVFVMRGSGTKGLVGQAGMVEECVEGTIFPDLFIRVPLNQDKVLPSFFVAWWNSPQMRDTIEYTAKTTSGIWKINQGHVASFSIPLPPFSEQHRIIEYLDGVQAQVVELKRLQAESAAKLERLEGAILARAFRGEL